jgi:hypothetical protein
MKNFIDRNADLIIILLVIYIWYLHRRDRFLWQSLPYRQRGAEMSFYEPQF